MFHFLLNGSSLTLACLTVAGFVLVASLAVVVVHRLAPWLAFARDSTDFGQIFGGAIGTMFALVFAMVTVAVWQNYDRVSGGVGEEANCIHNIYRYLDSYPREMREPTRALLRSYLRELIDGEWPRMREGAQDAEAHRLITEINARISAFRPASLGDLPLHEEMLRQVSRYRSLRHDRIRAGTPYLDRIMWISLTLGSGILLAFCSVWRMPNLKQHIMMASALGASLGIVFFLMLAYNHPFDGPGAIDCSPFRVLLEKHWTLP